MNSLVVFDQTQLQKAVRADRIGS